MMDKPMVAISTDFLTSFASLPKQKQGKALIRLSVRMNFRFSIMRTAQGNYHGENTLIRDCLRTSRVLPTKI